MHTNKYDSKTKFFSFFSYHPVIALLVYKYDFCFRFYEQVKELWRNDKDWCGRLIVAFTHGEGLGNRLVSSLSRSSGGSFAGNSPIVYQPDPRDPESEPDLIIIDNNRPADDRQSPGKRFSNNSVEPQSGDETKRKMYPDISNCEGEARQQSYESRSSAGSFRCVVVVLK